MTWRQISLRMPTTNTRRSYGLLSAELASTATFGTTRKQLDPIMSDLIQHPCVYKAHGRQTDSEKVRERRQWVRFVIPNLVTRVGWNNGTETVMHLVNLVNVSANGAAVLMDVKPPTDRPCTILFEHGGVSSGPICAELVSMTATDAGNILAKFAFDSVQQTRDLIRGQKERRAWQRVVPRETRACLSWLIGNDTVSVPGAVQNISGGGVAVQTDVTPPWNQAIWLSVGPPGEETDPAECRLAGVQHDQAGKLIARFAFVDLCPLQLYQAAVGISK